MVNDGSTDNTPTLLKGFAKRHPGFRVLDIPHAGKVAAVSSGVFDAKGEYVLFTDFDQSTPITEVDKVMEKFSQGADVVIGERNSRDVNRTLFQSIRSKLFNLLVQLVLLPGIRDSQCGFKAFKAEAGKQLFSELQVTHRTQKGGYMGAFDAELLFLARKHGFAITSIPVAWKYYQSDRLSWTEPLKMARDVVLVGLMDLKGWRTHIIPLILLLLLTIPAFRDTARKGFFPMHDDLQFTRQFIMDECFKDGQFPCRWSKHLGYGYGYPLFNYYPPLPYYIGQPFRWVGLQYVDVVKILVILHFIVSGLTMYLLAKEFWGRWGGLVSGLLFIYAPYHAVDIYVRAAMNEAWALTWFPVVLWSIYKLITTQKPIFVALVSFFAALLLLSHNPMTMVFTPLALAWTLFWLVQSRNIRVLPKLLLGGLWAFGLAAFFTLPVLFETKYVHIETLTIGYFNYLAHFVDLNQLFFSRYWGFGASVLGPNDEMSFQIGLLHWGLALASLVAALFMARKKPAVSLSIILIFTFSAFYTFMTHQRSSFIWSKIPQLLYLQFPWRFLTLTVFGTSFLAGSIVAVVKSRRVNIGFVAVIVVALLFLYKDYFKWREHWPYVTDGYRYTKPVWDLQITSGIFDYLPVWAPMPPANPPHKDAEIISGKGEVETIFKNGIKQEYQVRAVKDSVLQLNTFYFPGWKYFVNNKEVEVDPYEDKELGRPRVHLSAGEYDFVAKFTNTPARTIGNTLSLLSWAILIVLVSYRYLPLKR